VVVVVVVVVVWVNPALTDQTESAPAGRPFSALGKNIKM